MMPGNLRLGPDLANIGVRQTNLVWHLLHLYNPQIVAQGSTMPPSRHLFETRRIQGAKSPLALDFPPSFAPKGFDATTHEVIPKQEAVALIEYMIRSRAEPYLFEAPPPLKPKKPAAVDAATQAPPSAPAPTNTPAR
jgi:cytochrome c oxidase cbb3-type subunit 2